MAERLNMRIHALPQELQDSILEMAIEVEPADDGAIHIDESYKSPVGLQLNRKMRAAFAKVYYSRDRIFQYLCCDQGDASSRHSPLIPWWNPDAKQLIRWLESLEPVHRDRIRTLRLDYQEPSGQRDSPEIKKGLLRLFALGERDVHDLGYPHSTPSAHGVLLFRLLSRKGVAWLCVCSRVSLQDRWAALKADDYGDGI